MKANIKEAFRSVMLGAAVADALGVPAEFKSRERLASHPVTDMTGYGTHNMPKGTWSDDTSMALATLDSLAKGWIDYNEIMDNFVEWCFRGKYTATGETFDIGGTCLDAICAYKDGKAETPFVGLTDSYSNGNGSLMRIHPFVLFLKNKDIPLDRKMKIIHDASSLTHAHERARVGCGIYATVLWALLDEPSKDALRDALIFAGRYYLGSDELSSYMRLFEGIEQLPEEKIKSSGYVVDTLEAAIWCVLTTNDYKTCVLKAVNLGEDTDTVAAVAGSLAGALYGVEGIPGEWLDALIRRDYIEDMCERAAKTLSGESSYRGKLFSILGDSISTLEGYSTPRDAEFYEGARRLISDVIHPEDTWWGQVIDTLGGTLLVNNSISGSLVCRHPLCEAPTYGCADERICSLGKEEHSPDVIMVFLGTNDWGYGMKPAPSSDAERCSTAVFSVAYGIMLDGLRRTYPTAELWCFTLPRSKSRDGSDFPYTFGGVHIKDYCDVIRAQTEKRSGCRLVDLYTHATPHTTIDGFHPDAEGMRTLSGAVLSILSPFR